MAWIFTNRRQFYLHEGENLLNGLLRVGVVAPCQCREGYCGTCKLQYQSLNEKTQINYANSPIFMLSDDEILPCCANVTGILKLDLE